MSKRHSRNYNRRVKRFFRNSETIFLARLEVLTGFIIGALGGIDWSALLSLDFSRGFNKQILAISGIAMVHGLVIEAARRRPGSTDPIG